MPAADRYPDKIGENRTKDENPHQHIQKRVEVVDRADRTGVKGKPRAKHENIAEPECHAGHYGETSDFARRQSGLRIDPIAYRARGDQRKARVKEIA